MYVYTKWSTYASKQKIQATYFLWSNIIIIVDLVLFYGHVLTTISNTSFPPAPWVIFNNNSFIVILQNKMTPTCDSYISLVMLLQCTNIQLSKFYSSVADGFWDSSKSKEICVVGRNHNTVLGTQRFIIWKYQIKFY